MDGVSQAAEITPRTPVSPTASAAEAARIVGRTTAVDAVGLEGRAASLATRSIKRDAKVWGLELAIRCVDLTTLEGSDTTGRIVAMCAKAVRPDPLRPEVPSVAAVCLYPQLVPVAVEQLRGTGVAVASVAGGFPSGLGPLDARLQEIRDVVAAGADEVDIVLNRSLFLGGRYGEAFEELLAAREAAGQTHMKVILEEYMRGSGWVLDGEGIQSITFRVKTKGEPPTHKVTGLNIRVGRGEFEDELENDGTMSESREVKYEQG